MADKGYDIIIPTFPGQLVVGPEIPGVIENEVDQALGNLNDSVRIFGISYKKAGNDSEYLYAIISTDMYTG